MFNELLFFYIKNSWNSIADKAFNLPQILLDTSSERSTEFNPDINNLNRLVNGVPKSRTPSFSLPTVVTLTNESQHSLLNNPEQSFQPSISKSTMKLKGVDSICWCKSSITTPLPYTIFIKLHNSPNVTLYICFYLSYIKFFKLI